ncbi:MAG: Gfo/Idh/MocA family oxidoreductase [Kiritimatiellae bacterium]|nr:Gfo/Idh/MocA family oxidoreductase [Kiritimatiellia bacterium]
MKNMNRRQFMAASGAAALAMGGYAISTPRKTVARDKINHACIGVGGMGYHDLQNFLSHPRARIVAICDVDANHLKKAAELVPEARCYTDWRELLAKEGDQIDSINAAVPDHMHLPIALTAMRAGKHVYCQKPLCHDVAECRQLAETARKTGVITQLGTQHASGAGDRMAVQWLRERLIGTVQRVILCSNRPGAIDAYRLVGPRPAKGEPAPEHLAWELWLGTAPEREYAPAIYHPAKWRAWQDFGTGWLGDIGCHIFDAVWKGMEMGASAPLSVIAEVQESWQNNAARRADVWPQSDHITWTFSGNSYSGGKEFTMEWFDGLIYPPADVMAMAKEVGFEEYPAESLMVIGTDGALLLPHSSGPMLLPKAKFGSHPRPKLEARNHYHHFLDACLGGDMCESYFEQTGPMTETILLGTIAIREPNTLLTWEPVSMRIPNSATANRLLRRTYRKGWEVPGIG